MNVKADSQESVFFFCSGLRYLTLENHMSQFDNSNTVALFSSEEGTLSGPIFFDDAVEHRCIVTLGDKQHAVAIYKKGKDGGAVGKALITGTVVRVTSRNAAAPTALMVLEGKKQVRRFALWRKEHVKGAYYQGRLDQVEVRNAPVL